MNIERNATMKFQPVSVGLGAILMVAALAVHAEPAAANTANQGACALLKAEDVTALLGSTPAAKPKKDVCTWTVSGSPKKLVIAKYPETGMLAEMGYSTAQKSAAKGGTVVNVQGVGERAFARLNQSGVLLVTIKQGKLLQILYSPGAAGADKDLEALKPVAAKAITAF
jgi:hypothetical protein